MITKSRVAYKIGFSSALSVGSISAYNDAVKWSDHFEWKEKMKIRKAFYRGWEEGRKWFVSVRREIMEQAVQP